MRYVGSHRAGRPGRPPAPVVVTVAGTLALLGLGSGSGLFEGTPAAVRHMAAAAFGSHPLTASGVTALGVVGASAATPAPARVDGGSRVVAGVTGRSPAAGPSGRAGASPSVERSGRSGAGTAVADHGEVNDQGAPAPSGQWPGATGGPTGDDGPPDVGVLLTAGSGTPRLQGPLIFALALPTGVTGTPRPSPDQSRPAATPTPTATAPQGRPTPGAPTPPVATTIAGPIGTATVATSSPPATPPATSPSDPAATSPPTGTVAPSPPDGSLRSAGSRRSDPE